MSGEDKSKPLPFKKVADELTSKFIRARPKEAEKILNALPLPEQLALALSRRGKERLQLILLSKRSQSLVRALPEPELYFTLKELGEEESLPLLAMAAPAQLTYVFDLEFWESDLLVPEKYSRWLELLRQADPAQFQNWLMRADPELLTTMLSKLVSVWVVDPDNLGAEPWREEENLFTLDEQYYFSALDENLRPLAERALVGLRELDAEKFYTILDEVRLTPVTETEATAYRVRQGRLSDHGFYDFDEAFSIYQFLSPARMAELEQNPERPEPKKTPAGRYPILLSKEVPSFLASSLQELSPLELEDFHHQFARLCNKIMVADVMDLTELDNLKLAVEKVYGYLELGLSAWARGHTPEATALLRRQWLDHIFSAGFSEALKLRFRGQRLADAPWFKSAGRPFHLFGEIDGSRLRGLLEPRPKFYAGGKSLGLREFRSMNDLRSAEKSLARAEFCGRLFFEALGLAELKLQKLIAAYPLELTFEVILATWLVNGAVKAQPDFESIAPKDLAHFVERGTRLDSGQRKIAAQAKAEMLNRLKSRAEAAKSISQDLLTRFFETAVGELESELTGIKDVKNIDPRYLNAIVLKNPAEKSPGKKEGKS